VGHVQKSLINSDMHIRAWKDFFQWWDNSGFFQVVAKSIFPGGPTAVKVYFANKDNYVHMRKMSEWERMFFAKRHLRTTKRKDSKINCKGTGGVPRQTLPFPWVKTMLCIPCKSIQWLCIGDGCPVR